MNQVAAPCGLCGLAPLQSTVDPVGGASRAGCGLVVWDCPVCGSVSAPPHDFRKYFDGFDDTTVWNCWQSILEMHNPKTPEIIARETLPCARCGRMPVWENIDTFHKTPLNAPDIMWVCPDCGESSLPPLYDRKRYGRLRSMTALLKSWNMWQACKRTDAILQRLLAALGDKTRCFCWSSAFPEYETSGEHPAPATDTPRAVRLCTDSDEILCGGRRFSLDCFRDGVLFLSREGNGYAVSMDDGEIGSPVLVPVTLGWIRECLDGINPC